MVACHGPRPAAEMGLALHEWLLAADWPADLLETAVGLVVMAPDGRTLERRWALCMCVGGGHLRGACLRRRWSAGRCALSSTFMACRDCSNHFSVPDYMCALVWVG